jgi:hypothetical protein
MPVILLSLILVVFFVLLLVFIDEWTPLVDSWVCEGCNNCDEPLTSSLFDIPSGLSIFEKYGIDNSWTRMQEFKVSAIITLLLGVLLIMNYNALISSIASKNSWLGVFTKFTKFIILVYLLLIYGLYGRHVINSEEEKEQMIIKLVPLGISTILLLSGVFFSNSLFDGISVITLIVAVSYTMYHVINICKPTKECDTAQEKDDCLGAGKICPSDPNKLSESCGSCLIDKKDDTDVDVTDITDVTCKEKGGKWTSQMSSCYWISDKEDSNSGECIYEMNKCSDPKADCSVFQTTNVFEECCGVDNWQKFMDDETLQSIKDENKKLGLGEDSKENIQGEYALKRASASEFHRREDVGTGLYD